MMKRIKIEFPSNGEKVRKTAIMRDTLDGLSASAKNEAFDFCEDGGADGYWSLLFEGSPGIVYEVEFVFDRKNCRKTLEPVKAITWKDDVIDDVQKAQIMVREK